jgi:hypothetical protein
MIRDIVGPEFRRLGLKGSGRNWEFPSATHWVVLGFQGSQSNGKASGRYTINMTVCERAAWAKARGENPALPPKPRSGVFNQGPFCWTRRIGQLLPGQKDKWWVLTASQPSDLIAVEIVEAVERFALPAILHRLAT